MSDGERDPAAPAADAPAPETWLQRFGPILGGLLIDAVDFATFGPLGLGGGFVLGGLTALAVCALNGIEGKRRWMLVGAAALYTALPFTEALPLATVMAILVRLAGR